MPSERFMRHYYGASKGGLIDITRASELTDEGEAILEDMFNYHPWSAAQAEHGQKVRDALQAAAGVIIAHVPPCPDRSAALRKLRECRMDCNSAITHGGKY